MKPQRIETGCAQAELVDREGVLILESERESVTVRGRVSQQIDLELLLNERKLFSGSADELEAASEAIWALQKLRTNHAFRQALTQLVDNIDAAALLAYLNQK